MSVTTTTRVIDVVSDASVALKWFYADGEERVDPSRALIEAHKARLIALAVLDITPCEVGNALLRGHAKASAERVAVVLDALSEVCPAIASSRHQMRLATELAETHGLTLYDAAYAAPASDRKATLVTLEAALLTAGLGVRPSELARRLAAAAQRWSSPGLTVYRDRPVRGWAWLLALASRSGRFLTGDRRRYPAGSSRTAWVPTRGQTRCGSPGRTCGPVRNFARR